MAAPKQNTNARRWTEKRLNSYLSKIDKAAGNPKNLFLGKHLVRLKLYKDIWSYWKKKFEDDEDIMDRMDLVEGMFEVNLFNAALRSEIPASKAIMSLRNAHGWRNNPDKKQEPKVLKMHTGADKIQESRSVMKSA